MGPPLKNIKYISIVIVLFLTKYCCIEAFSAYKRNIVPERDSDYNYRNEKPVQVTYDEYPLVVPKRAAILLDRLMVALHHALEDERNGSKKILDIYKPQASYIPDSNEKPFLNEISSSLVNGRYDILNGNQEEIRQDFVDKLPIIGSSERNVMGPSRNRVYWRCHFNAVTCF